MREPPNIPEDQLRACLQDQYDLAAVTLEFLPLGLDFRAGVYRVVSEQGTVYLLKAKAGSLYEPGCLVPRYLRDQGIAAVVAPFPTKSSALWTRLGEWTLIVYPFIEGETALTGMTDAQWQAVGAAIRQIHQVRPPAEGFESVRKETFDPSGYRRAVQALEAQYIGAKGGGPAEQALRSYWLTHQSTVHIAVTALEQLAEVLCTQPGPRVICHADLHPHNIIRVRPNHVFVIDWDDVMLAPKERDFLFVGEPPVDGSVRPETAPFFQGYGPTEIDWVALTYYLWERLVQDVIECAKDVFTRGDLEEATRVEAAELFRDVLSAEGNKAEQALAAAAHLPADLRSPKGDAS